MKILNLAHKQDSQEIMINLEPQLLSAKCVNKKEQQLMSKINNIMTDLDYKTMQFEKLSNELSPLDFYNEYDKLDNWQVKTLENIDNNISN